jgi:hypothetical protein
LIPLAERWGISDDLIRNDVLEEATPAELEHLTAVLQEHGNALDEWLSGPEAELPSPSLEYVAFSAMRTGVDWI